MQQGLPTSVVVVSKKIRIYLDIASQLLHSPISEFMIPKILLGRNCWSIKNVIAMVAGAVDGLNLGNNVTAAVITRGLAEIVHIGVKLGRSCYFFRFKWSRRSHFNLHW